jgi:hypothetical protein
LTVDENVPDIPFSLYYETTYFHFTGDHYIHLYWSDIPLDSSPILAYCPGPILPIDHSRVMLTGSGLREARATVPAEFLINGKKAGPGKKCCSFVLNFVNVIDISRLLYINILLVECNQRFCLLL